MTVDASGNILLAGFANSANLPGLWNTPFASRPLAASSPGFGARLTPHGSDLSPIELLNGFQRDDLADPTGEPSW